MKIYAFLSAALLQQLQKRFTGTTAKTDTSTIIIKCTATATDDNDIVQKGMFVEFIS